MMFHSIRNFMSYLKYFVVVLLCVMGQQSVYAATYRLERVTSVESGGLYVFEQDGHVMNNSISSNALETTDDYDMTGLTGEETYVWTLEQAADGYYMKNVSVGKYLVNIEKDNANVALSSSKTMWMFTFDDGVVLIENGDKAYQNKYRFLAYSSASSYVYKAYGSSSLSKYPHAIVVYKLVEENEVVEDVSSPAFSPAGGTYSEAQEVAISCETDGANIYYTTDGTLPSGSSAEYKSPLLIEETTTIKAVAMKGGAVSEVVSATFVITSISDDKTLKNPDFSFDQEVYYADADGGFVAPTLNHVEGYDGTVTYGSSNEEVATVNPATGEVTVTGIGTTVITASAEETETFYAAAASYTLIVKEIEGEYETEDGVFDFTLGYDYGSGMSQTASVVNMSQDERTWMAGRVVLKTYGRVLWSNGKKMVLYRISDKKDIEGTCELSVPDGVITQIDIEADAPERLVADCDGSGKLDGAEWTGSAQKVTLRHCGTGSAVNVEKLTIIYDVVDAIEGAGVGDADGSGVYYNLRGQRVLNPSNGIYILNNRKVLIK